MRPIRYVVAFAPGGINDIMARIVAQKLNESWGQPVIVDNRPGAGGNLAAGLVARAQPDGYTFMNISTAHTISQTLYTKLEYSLERDLTPVVVLGNSPLIMVVHGGLPVKSVAELIDWAKKNRLIYASGGIGVIWSSVMAFAFAQIDLPRAAKVARAAGDGGVERHAEQRASQRADRRWGGRLRGGAAVQERRPGRHRGDHVRLAGAEMLVAEDPAQDVPCGHARSMRMMPEKSRAPSPAST